MKVMLIVSHSLSSPCGCSSGNTDTFTSGVRLGCIRNTGGVAAFFHFLKLKLNASDGRHNRIVHTIIIFAIDLILIWLLLFNYDFYLWNIKPYLQPFAKFVHIMGLKRFRELDNCQNFF